MEYNANEKVILQVTSRNNRENLYLHKIGDLFNKYIELEIMWIKKSGQQTAYECIEGNSCWRMEIPFLHKSKKDNPYFTIILENSYKGLKITLYKGLEEVILQEDEKYEGLTFKDLSAMLKMINDYGILVSPEVAKKGELI
jgi:hypothetical protein